jgi:hypothetical protein
MISILWRCRDKRTKAPIPVSLSYSAFWTASELGMVGIRAVTKLSGQSASPPQTKPQTESRGFWPYQIMSVWILRTVASDPALFGHTSRICNPAQLAWCCSLYSKKKVGSGKELSRYRLAAVKSAKDESAILKHASESRSSRQSPAVISGSPRRCGSSLAEHVLRLISCLPKQLRSQYVWP